MLTSQRCISGATIWSKAQQPAKTAKNQVSLKFQIRGLYSEGWPQNFKKREGLKAFRLLGEDGDVIQTTMVNNMKSIRNKISTYALKDILPCDKSGLL